MCINDDEIEQYSDYHYDYHTLLVNNFILMITLRYVNHYHPYSLRFLSGLKYLLIRLLK